MVWEDVIFVAVKILECMCEPQNYKKTEWKTV